MPGWLPLNRWEQVQSNEIEANYMGQDEMLQIPAGFSGRQGDLIPLLQWLQKRDGYISRDGVRQLARLLKISENHIFGVASFYSQFRFRKPGDNLIRVCQGTACHVQGGDQLSQEIQKKLSLCPGETTPDNRYEYQEVACLGCCAQASVVEINGKIYAKMTPDRLGKVLDENG